MALHGGLLAVRQQWAGAAADSGKDSGSNSGWHWRVEQGRAVALIEQAKE